MKLNIYHLLFLVILAVFLIPARLLLASGANFNDTTNKPITSSTTFTSASFSGNTGIGTTTPQTLLAVVGGNLGIGTWTAGAALIIKGNGNVGVGSAWPGQLLDVVGGIRIIGNNAYSIAQTTAVTLSSCGSSPTLTTGSTDFAGQFTSGGSGPTSCTVNFGHTWHTAPNCIAEFVSGIAGTIRQTATSTISTTFTFPAGETNKIFNYICGPYDPY
jgi:hypothetical protein